MELARADGMRVEECELTAVDVQGADEVFLTSSTREVQSAVMHDGAAAPVGAVTGRLAALYRERVGEELGI